jgi:TolB-like protein/tetratricopeptide (TPR) repeat protein/DNA-binding winged helix-turn-helix (wHTH) protein
MQHSLLKGFYLQDLLIEPANGRVSGPGVETHLKPKAVEVLLYLAERPFELVAREELLRAVWGDDAGSSEALTHTVSELRSCCKDHANSPTVIQTVPRRGYRLLQQPRLVDDPDKARTQDNSYSSAFVAMLESLRRRRVFRAVGVYAIFAWLVLQIADVVTGPLGFPPWTMTALVFIVVLGFPATIVLAWTLQITDAGIVFDDHTGGNGKAAEIMLRPVDYVIAGTLILILGFLALQLADRDSPIFITTESGQFQLPTIEVGSISPNSIAVLPFVNLGVDREGEFLGLGLAEEVLNLLANIKELKVPSRQMSFQYKGSAVGVRQIAEELRVKNILEGSVQGDGNELRITAQLIDAESGYHLWSQTYKRESKSMLAIRDEIAQSVVDSLRVVLSVESKEAMHRAPTLNRDAYDYYLQGLTYLRRPKTNQTLTNAEGLFRRALDLDPEYAKAYAGLCEVYLGKYQQFSTTEHVSAAEQACSSALSLDPNLPEVHTALGGLYRYTGDYSKAELAFQRAIVLDPRLEPAFYGLGRVYMVQNRLDEAEQLFKYAVQLEPGYWGTHLALGNYYLEFGRPAEAVVPFRRVTELNPGYAMGYNNLGAALYNSGQTEAGEEAFLESLEVAPTQIALSNVGSMYYNIGRFEDAVEMFNRASEIAPDDFALYGRLAAARRFVPGQQDQATEDFRRAIDLAEANLEINPNDYRNLAYVASYYAYLGEFEKADIAIQKAQAIGPKDPHVHFFRAQVEMQRGNHEAAINSLRLAGDLGYSIKTIASDPDFAPLYSNPRYRAIIDQ